MTLLLLLGVVVIAALAFDLINGFHDAGNAIATSVATGALSLTAAIILSSLGNLAGALSGTRVAAYIAHGIAARADVTTPLVVLGALLGASAWNLITWWYGLPSSSSHALIGGLCGSILAHAHTWSAIVWRGIAQKVLLPLVVAPVTGFLVALTTMIVLFWLLRRAPPRPVLTHARVLQPLAALALSFAHGQNDAQKTMGVIVLALASYVAAVQAGHQPLPALFGQHPALLPVGQGIPLWVVLACALAMAAGTAIGGRRIIKTMATGITRLDPVQGCIAQVSGTLVILGASRIGLPVSTTHNMSAAILGAGASRRLTAVRWTVAFHILVAWILTAPAAGAVAYVVTTALEHGHR